jgi:hypothetical protein
MSGEGNAATRRAGAVSRPWSETSHANVAGARRIRARLSGGQHRAQHHRRQCEEAYDSTTDEDDDDDEMPSGGSVFHANLDPRAAPNAPIVGNGGAASAAASAPAAIASTQPVWAGVAAPRQHRGELVHETERLGAFNGAESAAGISSIPRTHTHGSDRHAVASSNMMVNSGCEARLGGQSNLLGDGLDGSASGRASSSSFGSGRDSLSGSYLGQTFNISGRGVDMGPTNSERSAEGAHDRRSLGRGSAAASVASSKVGRADTPTPSGDAVEIRQAPSWTPLLAGGQCPNMSVYLCPQCGRVGTINALSTMLYNSGGGPEQPQVTNAVRVDESVDRDLVGRKSDGGVLAVEHQPALDVGTIVPGMLVMTSHFRCCSVDVSSVLQGRVTRIR